MVWNPNFPLQSTNVNQSTAQIQANWNFIETTVGTDHYYDTGAPNEGHHQYVQMLNLSPDPALAAGMDMVLFSRVQGTIAAWPCFRTPTTIYRSGLVVRGDAVIPTQGVHVLFSFAGSDSPIGGRFCVYDENDLGNYSTCDYVYDGISLTSFFTTSLGGQILISASGLDDNMRIDLSVLSTPPVSVRWNFTVSPF